MRQEVNDTHDPDLRSWVEPANAPGAAFPIQNLPFGVFEHGSDVPHIGVAIGDRVLDVGGCEAAGLLDRLPQPIREASIAPTLNALMALGPEAWSGLRRRISDLLRADSSELRDRPALAGSLAVPMSEVRMRLPAVIGDYTDFYASIHHARRVGALFRPENPLLPNYRWMPIGYHGRSSSIVPSGTPVRRPQGQTRGDTQPRFGPAAMLDYELELGFFIGLGNPLGEPVPIEAAGESLFGVCLVNDWSARDIQSWEYQPLGPFLSKSFATSVSPWVVTMEALAPFRVPVAARPPGDPAPLAYLDCAEDRERGGLAIALEVWFSSAAMRAQGIPPVRLSRANFADMYWTAAQLVAHHTSNGCNLRPGDLLASGTVSGPAEGQSGCLLEMTERGMKLLRLPTGEERRFLEDGDEVILRGGCVRNGFVAIGVGECRGMIVPAKAVAGRSAAG
jgi:fumarylacetoacetase